MAGSGSSNANKLIGIVDKVSASQIVAGVPGAWSASLAHAVFAAQKLPKGWGGKTLGLMSPDEAALVHAAITRSNAGAAAVAGITPASPVTLDAGNTTCIAYSAARAGGPPTPEDIIGDIVKGLTNIADAEKNIKAIEQGGQATLHWWGWELKLKESATTAFESLLKTDIIGLASIATALAFISPVLAAVAGIVSAVSTGLDAWISAEDTAHAGVNIKGYLWVGIWVTPL
jgi:hypothetical protein